MTKLDLAKTEGICGEVTMMISPAVESTCATAAASS
jgi:hypothetical protein